MKGKSKFFKRTLAKVMAVVMTMTAGVFVFADADFVNGYSDKNYTSTSGNYTNVSFKFEATEDGIDNPYNFEFNTTNVVDGKIAIYQPGNHNYCICNPTIYAYYNKPTCKDSGLAMIRAEVKHLDDGVWVEWTTPYVYFDNVLIPKIDHIAGPWITTTEPTASSVGEATQSCIMCNKTMDTKELAKHTHSGPEAVLTIIPATCTQVGKSAKFCNECKAFYDLADIAATKHCEEANYLWEVTTPATCVNKGVMTAKCCNCGKAVATKDIEVTPHIYSEYFTELYPATKDTEGLLTRCCLVCGAEAPVEARITIPAAHTHEYTSEKVIIKEPTCTEKGLKAKFCTTCFALKPDSITEINAKEHSDVTYTETIAATCTTAGEIRTICSECNKVIKTEAIPAINHANTTDITFLQPTCAEEGTTVTMCKDCGAIIAETPITKTTEHTWQTIVLTEATESTAGKMVKRCAVCGKDGEEITIPKNHTHEYNIPLIKEATCIDSGYSVGTCSCGAWNLSTYRTINRTNHIAGDWVTDVPGDCTHGAIQHKYCQRCFAITAERTLTAEGHDQNFEYPVVTANCAKDGLVYSFCSKCGKMSGSAIVPKDENAHDYQWKIVREANEATKVSGIKKLQCTRCGNVAETVEVPVHNCADHYGAIEIIEPTCELEGYKMRKCTVCDAYDIIEVTDALKHSDCTLDIVPATCAHTGLQITKCSRCGLLSGSKVLPKTTDHTPGEWVEVVPVTATSNGFMVQYCAECGAQVDSKVVDAHTHVYGAFEVLYEPTCDRDGVEAQLCIECGAMNSETVKRTEGKHVPSNDITVKAPTCTESGMKEVVCLRCDKKLSSEVIPALSHNTSSGMNWFVEKEPTCTATGLKVLKCVDCGKTVQTEITTKDHNTLKGTNWYVVKDATCTENGEKVLKCADCGAIVERQSIHMTGHNTKVKGTHKDDWRVTKDATCTEKGEEGLWCSNCEKFVSYRQTDALGHTGDGNIYPIDEPTCTKPGLEGKFCTRCKQFYETSTLPAFGHNTKVKGKDDWRVTKDATCTEKGEEGLWCSNCQQYVAYRDIKAKGHVKYKDLTWDFAKESDKPTCTVAGILSGTCPDCGVIVETQVVPALGHTCTTHANCLHDGICDRCGLVVEYADAKAHVFSEWTTFKKATFFKDEVQKRTCHVCGLNEYQFIDGSSGVHQKCCLHRRDSGCCFLCKVTRSVQTTFFVIFHGAGAVIGGNIVSRVLFPDLWKWTFCEIFRFPFVKYDK